ncbi:Mor transcription activator family protein [Acidovorax facilis]|uniref:Mor transcription activator family protein n=1 Tax=Acidovorax facilis TaxID=12917 RepID=UPI003CF4A20B
MTTKILFDEIQPLPQTAAQAEDAAVQLERDFLTIVREDIGMNEGFAGLFARALVDGLRRRLGGQELYIPAPDRSERDAGIRREFDGTPDSLARIQKRTGLSRTRIYEICARGQAKNPALPLETGRAHA